jgi:hypothetical protein
MELLYAYVTCEDAHVNYMFTFFDISKCTRVAFQNKENICTQEANHHSQSNSYETLAVPIIPMFIERHHDIVPHIMAQLRMFVSLLWWLP